MTMLRLSRPAVLVLCLGVSPATRASAQNADTRPTIAVLYFTNSALIRHADYDPLSKGITDMLITQFSTSPGLRVVERDRLQQLIQEQDLSAGKRVDEATAVRLGKILGVHHLVMGGFVIDPKERMRLDVRSVDVETSRVEYVETVAGKAEDVLDLVDQLGRKVAKGLKLPPMPAPASQPTSRKTSKSDQLQAVILLSRALEREDRGDRAGAVALYREALQVYPEYDRAKVLLASATGAR
ncbi:MAG TPA: CsgG/HfaB family protein [Gemmatimonadales bacterium]|jgi:TolB-like protein|nr:CsgG/HfaB family protein [Gemmatimonadales bacterium]